MCLPDKQMRLGSGTRASTVVFFFFPQPRLFPYSVGCVVEWLTPSGGAMGRSLFNTSGALRQPWRDSRRRWKRAGACVSRRGYPVTTAFSSLNPGIGGIGCDIAPQEFTRLNLAQRESSVSWITPGNCVGYWKDQPGRPSEKLEGRMAPRCSRGYPGPQTMPKYRINKTTHQPQAGLSFRALLKHEQGPVIPSSLRTRGEPV